jgi:hypothetical protein
MKNIKKGETIKRVSDTEAIFFVKNGWEYCSKSEWKKNRGVKVKTEVEQEVITDNISDKKKRKLRKENKRKKYQNN